MKTVTIRDLRLKWPETEKSLLIENELTVTRDGHPVARLVHITKTAPKRHRWDAGGHKKWLKKIWGGKVFGNIDERLAHDRADRWEKEAR